MNKLKNQAMIKAILKIILSIFYEILLIIVFKTLYEKGQTFPAIICLILFSIVCLMYFVLGLNVLLNCNYLLKDYLKKNSNITMQQLDDEFKSAQKIGNIYIGNQHMFSNDSLGIMVIPINSITKLEIAHLGANPAKMRNGYYYLYVSSNISETKRKIYAVTDIN